MVGLSMMLAWGAAYAAGKWPRPASRCGGGRLLHARQACRLRGHGPLLAEQRTLFERALAVTSYTRLPNNLACRHDCARSAIRSTTGKRNEGEGAGGRRRWGRGWWGRGVVRWVTLSSFYSCHCGIIQLTLDAHNISICSSFADLPTGFPSQSSNRNLHCSQARLRRILITVLGVRLWWGTGLRRDVRHTPILKAALHFQQSKPDQPDAICNLATWSDASQKLLGAVPYFEAAILIQPGSPMLILASLSGCLSKIPAEFPKPSRVRSCTASET